MQAKSVDTDTNGSPKKAVKATPSYMKATASSISRKVLPSPVSTAALRKTPSFSGQVKSREPSVERVFYRNGSDQFGKHVGSREPSVERGLQRSEGRVPIKSSTPKTHTVVGNGKTGNDMDISECSSISPPSKQQPVTHSVKFPARAFASSGHKPGPVKSKADIRRKSVFNLNSGPIRALPFSSSRLGASQEASRQQEIQLTCGKAITMVALQNLEWARRDRQKHRKDAQDKIVYLFKSIQIMLDEVEKIEKEIEYKKAMAGVTCTLIILRDVLKIAKEIEEDLTVALNAVVNYISWASSLVILEDQPADTKVRCKQILKELRKSFDDTENVEKKRKLLELSEVTFDVLKGYITVKSVLKECGMLKDKITMLTNKAKNYESSINYFKEAPKHI